MYVKLIIVSTIRHVNGIWSAPIADSSDRPDCGRSRPRQGQGQTIVNHCRHFRHRECPDCWQLRPSQLWAVKTKIRSQGCVPESRRISRIIAAHHERLRINRLWVRAVNIGYIDRRLWPVVVAYRIEKDVPLSNPDRHDQPYENSKVIRITEY